MFKFWKKASPEPARPGETAPQDAPGSATTPEPVAAIDTDAQADSVGLDASIPAAAHPATPAPADASQARPSWRERLRNSAFVSRLGQVFTRNPKLDDDLLDELETALITADVGVASASALVDSLRKRMHKREFADAGALQAALRIELTRMLDPVAVPLQIPAQIRPYVVLVVGVNGVGKTTTIGKLARRWLDEGLSVMLAAGDTFRAAAVEQLKTWGERNQVTVMAQGQGADSASVIFDAFSAAKARGVDVLIADTAGRLHTQSNLMDELAKIKRVLARLDPDAPHEVLMVIDGTTGQNALSQLRQFHQSVKVSGLVVTKLDGTAKGGVVFALAREFGIPLRFVGIGESIADLRAFEAAPFVDAMLPADGN